MISVAMAWALSQLAGSDKEYDKKEKKKPAQSYSTNADKKVRFKSILKKFRIKLPIRVYVIYLLRLT